MRNTLINLPWGTVYTVSTKSVFIDPVFRGNPAKYAEALKVKYSTWGAALGFLDGKDNQSLGQVQFFKEARNYILNRIAGKTRKNRKASEQTA